MLESCPGTFIACPAAAAAMATPPALAPPADRPDRPGDDRVLAAVAYILTLLTGIVVYMLAKPEDKYTRWHALQAIGFGIAAIVIGILLGVVSILFAFGSAVTGSLPGIFLGGALLGVAWNLVVVVLIVVLAIKAYQGEKLRLPIVAEFADRHA